MYRCVQLQSSEHNGMIIKFQKFPACFLHLPHTKENRIFVLTPHKGPYPIQLHPKMLITSTHLTRKDKFLSVTVF